MGAALLCLTASAAGAASQGSYGQGSYGFVSAGTPDLFAPVPHWPLRPLDGQIQPLPGGQDVVVIGGDGVTLIQAPRPAPPPALPPILAAQRSLPAGSEVSAVPATVSVPDQSVLVESDQDQFIDAAALPLHRPRWYLQFRGGQQFYADSDIAPSFETEAERVGNELVGTSVGYAWNRYLSTELALDFHETNVNNTDVDGQIGEYTVVTLMPTVKAKYPVMNDRLVPYVSAGVGIGHYEFNDRNSLGSDPVIGDFKSRGESLAWSLGLGFDYFVADNVAFGLDGRYVFQEADIDTGGGTVDGDLDSILLSGTVTFLFPGPERQPRPLDPGESLWALGEIIPTFGLRLGATWQPDIEITDEFDAPHKEREQIFGVQAGVELNRYWAVDLVLEHYETVIHTNNNSPVLIDDAIRELSIWTLIPTLRYSYPIWDDLARLYAVAGAGVGFVEANDRQRLAANPAQPQFSARGLAPVGVLGGGFEYFIAENMSVGGEVRYLLHRPDVEVDGVSESTNFDTILFTTGLKVYFN